MPCTNCGKEIPANSRFCGFCGSKQQLSNSCPACSKVLNGNPRFCPYCGSALSSQPAQTAQPYATATPPPAPPAAPIPPGEAFAAGQYTASIVSPEATVGVGKRFVAVLIDGIVLSFIGYLLAMMTGQTTGAGAPAFLWFLILLAYYVVMEKMYGATVGKMALGMKVLKTDGTPLEWNDSLIRNLLRIVDALFFYLLGAILIWTSPLQQRLGDRVAKTVVVKKSSLA